MSRQDDLALIQKHINLMHERDEMGNQHFSPQKMARSIVVASWKRLPPDKQEAELARTAQWLREHEED